MIILPSRVLSSWHSRHYCSDLPAAVNQNAKTALRQNLYKAIHQHYTWHPTHLLVSFFRARSGGGAAGGLRLQPPLLKTKSNAGLTGTLRLSVIKSFLQFNIVDILCLGSYSVTSLNHKSSRSFSHQQTWWLMWDRRALWLWMIR